MNAFPTLNDGIDFSFISKRCAAESWLMLSVGNCFMAVETVGWNDECVNTSTENALWAAATARYVVRARLVKSSVASFESCSLASPLMMFPTTFSTGIPGMSSGEDSCGCRSEL